jgi:2,3-bisphosphoglycerate-independent phosphoglycerate mutase
MKYAIMIGDGMADRPVTELGGLTPLQAACTPNMDNVAAKGVIIQAKTIPQGYPAGSDVASLSIMGYDPQKSYTGRAPLEAASLGIRLRPHEVAFRCNMVTISDSPADNPLEGIMQDFTAGHISTTEAHKLIEILNLYLGNSTLRFYTGVSYRHILLWGNGPDKVSCTPPHDIIGKSIRKYLPQGRGDQGIKELMAASRNILAPHPINLRRLKTSQLPANNIWLWGQGKAPQLLSYKEKYNLSGAIISAVDLIKGLGKYAGLNPIKVPGATGYLDTNYRGKADAALNELENNDIVFVHVEAPDEASHNGNLQQKIQAIEQFDSLVVGTILKGMQKFKEYKIMVLSDHATPLSLRTHSPEPVPVAIYNSQNEKNTKQTFSEACATDSGICIDPGWGLIDYLFREA